MELIAVETSRLTSLFLAVSPRGQLHMPTASGLLVDRYKFAAFPKSIDDLTGERISFKHGVMDGLAIDAFDIYNDGVVVSSKSPSNVLDHFLDDLHAWMGAEFGLRRLETHEICLAYESHVLIHSDENLLAPLDALAQLQDLIGRLLKESTKLEAAYRPYGFALHADASLISSLKPTPFRLERRAGLAFETNYYVSSAPLRTADHMKVLERLEKLF